MWWNEPDRGGAAARVSWWRRGLACVFAGGLSVSVAAAQLPVVPDGSESTGGAGTAKAGEAGAVPLLYRGVSRDGASVDVFVRGAEPGATVLLHLYVGFEAALSGEQGMLLRSGVVDATGAFHQSFDRASLGLDDSALARARVLTMRAYVVGRDERGVFSNVAIFSEAPSLHLLLESVDGSEPTRLVRFDPFRGEVTELASDVTLGHEDPFNGALHDASRFAIAGPKRGLFYESTNAPQFLCYDDPEDPTPARVISTLVGHDVLDMITTPDRSKLLVLSRQRDPGSERSTLHLRVFDAMSALVTNTQGVLLESHRVVGGTGLEAPALMAGNRSRKVYVSYRAHAVDRLQEFELGEGLRRGPTFAPSPHPAAEFVHQYELGGRYLVAFCEDERGARGRVVVFDVLQSCKLLEQAVDGRPLDCVVSSSDQLFALTDAGGGRLYRLDLREPRAEVEDWDFPGATELVDGGRGVLHLLVVESGRARLECWTASQGVVARVELGAGQFRGLGRISGAGTQWVFAVRRGTDFPQTDELLWTELDSNGRFLQAEPRRLPLAATARSIRE